MKKISQSQLSKIEKSGTRVQRPKKPKPEPKPEPVVEPPKQEAKPHASMSASMDHVEAQVKATLMATAQNGELLRQFRESMETMLEPREPSEYTFDVVRDDDGLLKRVLARPGIEETA